MCLITFIFFIPTIYNAYISADTKTYTSPLKLMFTSLLLFKKIIPLRVSAIALIIVKVIFSLKNTVEITATIIGYTNKIVHAIPDGIKLNAVNNVKDDSENSIAKTNKASP